MGILIIGVASVVSLIWTLARGLEAESNAEKRRALVSSLPQGTTVSDRGDQLVTEN